MAVLRGLAVSYARGNPMRSGDADLKLRVQGAGLDAFTLTLTCMWCHGRSSPSSPPTLTSKSGGLRVLECGDLQPGDRLMTEVPLYKRGIPVVIMSKVPL